VEILYWLGNNEKRESLHMTDTNAVSSPETQHMAECSWHQSPEVSREHNLNLGWQACDTGCYIHGTHAKQICDIITESNLNMNLIRWEEYTHFISRAEKQENKALPNRLEMWKHKKQVKPFV
jgi:hypothetical protein